MANILQLCVRYPPAPGGAETRVRALSEELSKLGHSVSVYTSDLYKEFPFTKLKEHTDRNKEIAVKRHSAYSLPNDLHYVFYPSLIKSMLEKDFDLFHAHSYGYFHVNTTAFIKHIKDKPFVLTPHYHPEWSMWGGKKRKFIRKFYDSIFAQRVIDSTDRIIGVSQNEIDLLSKRLNVPSEKVRIIPNGIDPEKFTPIPDGEIFKEKFNLDGKIVLYTGRLASNKGLLNLVEVIPKVLEKNPSTTFVLIGEDEGMKKEIELRANELDVEDNLKIIGYIDDYDLFKSAYSAADVYTLPSEYEAFGIVLLEAMMCKTPCVATEVGGIPEVIKDEETGFLVEYGDNKNFAEAINKLLKDKRLREKMGKKGRKKVLDKFTWEKVANRVNEVYKELL